jgi:hypothetical protein
MRSFVPEKRSGSRKIWTRCTWMSRLRVGAAQC